MAKVENDAQKKASETMSKAEQESQRIQAQARADVQELKIETQENKKRLIEKEAYLDTREKELTEDKKEQDKLKAELENTAKLVKEEKEKQTKKLESLANLTQGDAKQQLFESLEEEYREDLFVRSRKLEKKNQETLDAQARDILMTAIHRYGNSVENDIMSTQVTLPDDDTKGKIIGKEGRNIKAFEKHSGVQLVIDDTPGVITISSFDPIRRAIAKQALESLIADGRIQPAKIEQEIDEARTKTTKLIAEKGAAAAEECGVTDLHPELLEILGRLYFRYSYGQNVLQHSIEMAHIAGVMAEQVGGDVYVAKAASLLHDIGKAVDHEIEGSHVDIGRRILKKYEVSDEVIKAMQAHHEEYPYENVESILVQVADAVSGGRPGARSDIADMYIKKLDGLERIAQEIPGVQEAYALSAGREVRVIVNPEEVDDYTAKKIARQVAKQIEQELKYPGEIKVHVIRESRIVDYAR